MSFFTRRNKTPRTKKEIDAPKQTVLDSHEIVAMEMARLALQKFWGHDPDWVPDWYHFELDKSPTTPIPGVHPHKSFVPFRWCVIKITGSILEARGMMGPSDVEITCYLEQVRGWVRGFGWEAVWIGVLANGDTKHECYHTFFVDYGSVKEPLGYVNSYRYPVIRPDPPWAPSLPWAGSIARLALPRVVIMDEK